MSINNHPTVHQYSLALNPRPLSQIPCTIKHGNAKTHWQHRHAKSTKSTAPQPCHKKNTHKTPAVRAARVSLAWLRWVSRPCSLRGSKRLRRTNVHRSPAAPALQNAPRCRAVAPFGPFGRATRSRSPEGLPTSVPVRRFVRCGKVGATGGSSPH